MFKRFYLRNIKVWGEQLWQQGVELAPVTLLLGPNSAGKTSLLQVPLLLRQTFESADRHLDLNLGGQPTDLVDFGTYEDLVHNHQTQLELGLGFDLETEGRTNKTSQVTYRATHALAPNGPVLSSLQMTADGAHFGVERQSKGGYLLSAPRYTPRQVGNRLNARRDFQPERSLMFSAEALGEIGEDAAKIQDLGLLLSREMSQVAYLGPLRERPERTTMWNRQSPGDLGSRGERAIQALLASANSRAARHVDQEGGRGWLVERVSTWLARMGVADRLTLERQGRSRYFEVIIHSEGRSANLMDVGFGLSQVLPMLVLAYFVPRGATVIAEQPEIHLHPRAQVGLAELMVEVAKERGVQFLVETHSEYLFRRLQFLLADEQLSPEQCRLYFVDRQSDRSARLEPLAIDPFGRVPNWPKNFFGDSVGETERQVRRMIQRLRAAPPEAGRD